MALAILGCSLNRQLVEGSLLLSRKAEEEEADAGN
jgi:hypothetical protein